MANETELKPNILIVDDDLQFLDTASLLLKRIGLVTSVHSCEQCFEVLAREPMDVIISDYYLGQGNGHDVIRHASKLTRPPPVILITGLADKEMAIRSANLHVFALLEKPVDMSMLIGTVERALRAGNPYGVGAGNPISYRSVSGLNIVLDSADRRVRLPEGRSIQLTETEFNILNFFMERAGKRVTRDEIVDAVWGQARLSRNVFDTHLSNLKRKVPAIGHVLKSIRGAGYLFE